MAKPTNDIFGITDDPELESVILGLTPATGWRAAFANPTERDPADRPTIRALASFALVDFVNPLAKTAEEAHVERAIRPMVAMEDGEIIDVEGLENEPLVCLIPPHVAAMDETNYIRNAYKRRMDAEKAAEKAAAK